MRLCSFCEKEPTSVWFDKDVRVWCITCPCDTVELMDTHSEQEACYVWEHGDKDGWQEACRQQTQGSLF